MTEASANYISPTYKSSPLFAPEQSPYNSRVTADNQPGWGTHIHQYAGIGALSFLGLTPKVRDLYVARSHRHFLSGLSYVKHDQVTPTQITPFKKSLNRANDDLVPPAALIPIEKYGRIIEDTRFVREDKYASHKEKSEVFPQRGTTTKLTPQTAEDISNLIQKRYGQTTYSESYYDQRGNTTLTLGPQFQFFESDEEEEKSCTEEKDEEDTTTQEATSSEVQTSQKDEEAAETENDAASTICEEDGQEDDQPEAEKVQTIEELRDEFEQAKVDEEKPFWPAWPGNHSNYIDPVTLKIAEKRDVLCRQDQTDVRALPVSTPLQQADYNILSSLQPQQQNKSIRHDFAPANVNFAYSGQQVKYGSMAERSQQFQTKPIAAVPGCSRFLAVPDAVNSNINRILSTNNTHQPMYHDIPNNNGRLRVRSAPHRDTLPTLVASTSLEELNNTVNNIRTPTVTFKPSSKEGTLPPLWESLTYSGDRVVDRLGVRYKSKAQARYHQSHPDRIPEILPEYLRDAVTCHNHPSRRRQYYNGHHCGSSFR